MSISDPFRLLSYNLNGIRSASSKGLLPWLAASATLPDVVCFQEVRPPVTGWEWSAFTALGYSAAHLHAAEKPGYSSVATLSRVPPLRVTAGTGHAEYDREGRVLRTDFADFTVLNVYIPSGARNERQEFKMAWLAHFGEFVAQIRAEVPALIICGDFNICHQPIDIHDPIGNKKSSGFLPDERAWLTDLLASGYCDSFRELHPTTAHAYTWWSNRPGVRARNKGWRIDYAVVSENLRQHLQHVALMPDALHSDHCPVWLELRPISATS
jgi:exodeoxyribonuclease III